MSNNDKQVQEVWTKLILNGYYDISVGSKSHMPVVLSKAEHEETISFNQYMMCMTALYKYIHDELGAPASTLGGALAYARLPFDSHAQLMIFMHWSARPMRRKGFFKRMIDKLKKKNKWASSKSL